MQKYYKRKRLLRFHKSQMEDLMDTLLYLNPKIKHFEKVQEKLTHDIKCNLKAYTKIYRKQFKTN